MHVVMTDGKPVCKQTSTNISHLKMQSFSGSLIYIHITITGIIEWINNTRNNN